MKTPMARFDSDCGRVGGVRADGDISGSADQQLELHAQRL